MNINIIDILSKNMGQLKVGEKTFETWAGGEIICVEDKFGCGGCEKCIFSEDGDSCPPRVYNQYPCYHSDREDGKDVHYERVS